MNRGWMIAGLVGLAFLLIVSGVIVGYWLAATHALADSKPWSDHWHVHGGLMHHEWQDYERDSCWVDHPSLAADADPNTDSMDEPWSHHPWMAARAEDCSGHQSPSWKNR